MKAQSSLKSRALQLLAQRDQSRIELRRKLLRHARNRAASPDDSLVETSAAEVEALLDWLETNRFLSQERFVESRVHARETRFGNLRIENELAQHGLAPAPEMQRALRESEFDRAASVRARRFPDSPCDAAERAAQSRFLAARGFSPEVIHRLMRRLRDAPAGPADRNAQAS